MPHFKKTHDLTADDALAETNADAMLFSMQKEIVLLLPDTPTRKDIWDGFEVLQKFKQVLDEMWFNAHSWRVKNKEKTAQYALLIERHRALKDIRDEFGHLYTDAKFYQTDNLRLRVINQKLAEEVGTLRKRVAVLEGDFETAESIKLTDN